jgi:hypothetical protein
MGPWLQGQVQAFVSALSTDVTRGSLCTQSVLLRTTQPNESLT